MLSCAFVTGHIRSQSLAGNPEKHEKTNIHSGISDCDRRPAHRPRANPFRPHRRPRVKADPAAGAGQAAYRHWRRSLREFLPVRLRELFEAVSHPCRSVGLRDRRRWSSTTPSTRCTRCSKRSLPTILRARRTSRRSATTTLPAWTPLPFMRDGLKPLQPELDRIAALTDKKQLDAICWPTTS